jgi:cytoskeletal protein RodZ
MQTVGSYLKSSREAKNISLSDISQHTKISKWYLDCLEKDELKNIPEGPYVKGYISSYAAFVGIDEGEALKKYDSSNLESKLTNQVKDQNPEERNSLSFIAFFLKKKQVLILSIILLILLTAGSYYLFFRSPKKLNLDENFKSPEQNEFQSSQGKVADVSSRNLKLEKTDSKIPKSVISKNLVSSTNTSLKSHSDNQSTDEISKNPEQLEASRTESPHQKPDSVTQGVQIQTNAESGIKVIKAVASGGIKDRGPIDIGNSFQWSKGKVYIWSMIDCTNPPLSIKHIYYFNEQKVSEVSLDVKSNQWRTWSYKTISDKQYIGQWRVDITSADGKVLETIRFEVN